jgi:hypothetical protein
MISAKLSEEMKCDYFVDLIATMFRDNAVIIKEWKRTAFLN